MSDEPSPPTPLLLIVEDEPAVRRSLQLLLQGHGFAVRGYGSGNALLADPAAPGAQGIVADYRLPDGDGLRLLGQLRRKGFAGPAIMITAHGSEELSLRAEAAGFERVLDKPFADHVLTKTLALLLPAAAPRA